MAISGSDFTDITAVASTGLTGNQWYLVRTTGVDSTYSAGNLTCLLATASTGSANGVKGVLQNDPDTGQAAIVRTRGLSKVVCGTAIAVGDLLSCSTGGTATVADTTGEWFWGKAESATTAAGQVFTARLFGSLTPFMGSTA
jgi:hypothetical protein